MDQLIGASLYHTHYWYEVGMLKVTANLRMIFLVYRNPAVRPKLENCTQPRTRTGMLGDLGVVCLFVVYLVSSSLAKWPRYLAFLVVRRWKRTYPLDDVPFKLSVRDLVSKTIWP